MTSFNRFGGILVSWWNLSIASISRENLNYFTKFEPLVLGVAPSLISTLNTETDPPEETERHQILSEQTRLGVSLEMTWQLETCNIHGCCWFSCWGHSGSNRSSKNANLRLTVNPFVQDQVILIIFVCPFVWFKLVWSSQSSMFAASNPLAALSLHFLSTLLKLLSYLVEQSEPKRLRLVILAISECKLNLS